MAHIALNWRWIDWNFGFKWSEDMLPQLAERGINELELDRSVYVLRLNPPFAIKYPGKTSPVIYIGEGNLKSRLSAHANSWIPELWELVEGFGLTVGVVTPRVRNNLEAYKDVEADLINEFAKIHGSAPLKNSQFEYSKIAHTYNPNEVKEPLLIGKGVRYKWEISPLKSNAFHEVFSRTDV